MRKIIPLKKQCQAMKVITVKAAMPDKYKNHDVAQWRRIIFNGSDEELFESVDIYIREFLLL
jgi:hypothetical protein